MHGGLGKRLGVTSSALAGLLTFASLAACDSPTRASGHDAGRPPPPVASAPARVTAPGESPADLEKSRITLSVIKDKDVTSPVVATLKLRDGAVSLDAPTPSARLSIDLNSFDSLIPIRNERVRGIFFETSAIGWETAELAIPAIPADVIATLKTKHQALHVKLDSTLKIHGKTAAVPLLVDVSSPSEGHLSVTTSGPIQVKVSDYGLTANLHRLSSICMHDSIDDIVNVTVALEFTTR